MKKPNQKKMPEQLSQKLSEIAHEIRNPLTSMKGMAQILAKNSADKEFIESFESMILRQIEKIDASVEKLLAIGKSAKKP